MWAPATDDVLCAAKRQKARVLETRKRFLLWKYACVEAGRSWRRWARSRGRKMASVSSRLFGTGTQITSVAHGYKTIRLRGGKVTKEKRKIKEIREVSFGNCVHRSLNTLSCKQIQTLIFVFLKRKNELIIKQLYVKISH